MASLRELVADGVVLVDEDVLETYGNNFACVHWNGYVSIQFSRKRKPRRRELLHRFLVPGFPVVHHVNCNMTDNRRSNLLGTTQAHNLFMKRTSKDNSTRGTRLHKKSGLWQARIHFNNKEHSLGYYKTQADARESYLLAQIEVLHRHEKTAKRYANARP